RPDLADKERHVTGVIAVKHGTELVVCHCRGNGVERGEGPEGALGPVAHAVGHVDHEHEPSIAPGDRDETGRRGERGAHGLGERAWHLAGPELVRNVYLGPHVPVVDLRARGLPEVAVVADPHGSGPQPSGVSFGYPEGRPGPGPALVRTEPAFARYSAGSEC